MDSSGLNMLVAARREAVAARGGLVVVNPVGQVKMVLDLTNLSKVLLADPG